MARIVTGNSSASAEDGALWLEALVKDLQVPGLNALCSVSLNEDQMLSIAELTAKASSTKGNPVVFDVNELKELLRQSL